jgi:hypothetical protein
MVLPDGRVLTDSWSIAREAGLPAMDEKFMHLYDTRLGPLVRQYAYSFILRPSNRNVWNGLCTTGSGWFWRILWWLGAGDRVTKLMSKIFASSSESAFAECRAELVSLFDTIAPRIKARKGRFLGGDSIGLEDIALASLAGPMVWPANYCGGAYAKWMGLLEAQDAELRRDLAYWRGTEVGAYVMRLYTEHRLVGRRFT